MDQEIDSQTDGQVDGETDRDKQTVGYNRYGIYSLQGMRERILKSDRNRV